MTPPRDSSIRSAQGKVADEEVVIYHLLNRDRTPPRDRLTPRMEARRIIDALDAARRAGKG